MTVRESEDELSYSHPQDAAQQKLSRKRGFGFYLLWSTGILVGGFITVMVVALLFRPDTVTKEVAKEVAVPGPTVTVPGPTVTVTVPAPAVTVTVTKTLIQEAPAPVSGGSGSTIDDGVWTVGTDIKAGTYKVTEAVSGSCYWAITKTGSNGSNIIENDIVEGGRPQVTLKRGQDFESSDCGTWSKMR
jgi:hypothetical protein